MLVVEQGKGRHAVRQRLIGMQEELLWRGTWSIETVGGDARTLWQIDNVECRCFLLNHVGLCRMPHIPSHGVGRYWGCSFPEACVLQWPIARKKWMATLSMPDNSAILVRMAVQVQLIGQWQLNGCRSGCAAGCYWRPRSLHVIFLQPTKRSLKASIAHVTNRLPNLKASIADKNMKKEGCSDVCLHSTDIKRYNTSYSSRELCFVRLWWKFFGSPLGMERYFIAEQHPNIIRCISRLWNISSIN